MDLEDYLREIEAEIQHQENMEEALKLLDKEIKKFRALLNEYDDLLEKLVPPEEAALNNATAVANDILKEEARLAITGTEFDIPEFRTRLETAIQDSRTLYLRLTGTNALDVDINLAITAGTLDDYTSALKKTRDQIRERTKTRQPKNLQKYNHIEDPNLAAFIWMEKYYSPARQGTTVPDRPDKRTRGKTRPNKTAQYIRDYWETIRMRIDNFTTLAPFWELLNLGGSTLGKDTGNKAYPVIRPTHFVNKALIRITNYFYSELQREKKRKDVFYDKISEYRDKINALYDIRDRIESSSEGARLIVPEPVEGTWGGQKKYSEFELRQNLYSRIASQQGVKIDDADEDKLQGLINALVNEIAVQGRVELTRSGSRDRVRVRTLELQEYVRSYKYD